MYQLYVVLINENLSYYHFEYHILATSGIFWPGGRSVSRLVLTF